MFGYDGEEWIQQAWFGGGAAMGRSVSISGDMAVGGMPDYGDPYGGEYRGGARAFYHDGTEWHHERWIYAHDPHPYAYFGWSVAVAGDVLAVGAPDAGTDYGEWEGAIYVYRYDGSDWNFEAKVFPDGYSGQLGRDVAASGAVIVGGGSGEAYVFRFDGSDWAEEVRLEDTDNPETGFGTSVVVDGDVILVGAPGWGGHGAVYVYRHNGSEWIEEALLTAFGLTDGDEFGASVALRGNQAAVGAPETETDGAQTGAAYLFQFDGSNWVEQVRLSRPPGEASDENSDIGRGVAFPGGTMYASAPHYDADESDEGAVFFAGGMDDCNANGMVDVCDIMEVVSSDCNGNRIPDECDLAGWESNYFVIEHDPSLAIPDSGSVSSVHDVTVAGVVEDVNIELTVLHADVGELMIWLEHEGVTVTLVNQCEGAGADFAATAFDDEADTPICDGIPPYSGLFTPDEPLSAFDGMDIQGAWTLWVSDTAADGQQGSLERWSLHLPVGVADCNDNGIPDDCDLDDGTSEDTNGNLAPDECDLVGDIDGDGDTDLRDWQRFEACYTGAEAKGVSPDCVFLDTDDDADIDLLDQIAFVSAMTGPTPD